MLFKIKIGIGLEGKLWTGQKNLSKWQGKIAHVRIFKFTCDKCEATTQKLYLEEPEIWQKNAEEFLELQTLLICVGGDGLFAYHSKDNLQENDLWNWSGRNGGRYFVSPLACVNGHVTEDDLPLLKEGGDVCWKSTYSDQTLSEFVLTTNTVFSIRPIELERTCPICREKALLEEEKSSSPVLGKIGGAEYVIMGGYPPDVYINVEGIFEKVKRFQWDNAKHLIATLSEEKEISLSPGDKEIGEINKTAEKWGTKIYNYSPYSRPSHPRPN